MITRIFFASDIHGSEVCWRKFINAARFYHANILILGGDLTGKALVPIVLDGNDCETFFLGRRIKYSVQKIEELERMILDKGCYPFLTTREEINTLEYDQEKKNRIFLETMTKTLRRWLAIADERLKGTNTECFVCPGNDDAPEIDSIIDESKSVKHAGDKMININDDHEMISLGWTNPSPWKTSKECSEDELSKKIDVLANQVENLNHCIFNLHAPPYGVGLDLAPQIDKTFKQHSRIFVPVGSSAVMNAIRRYQPLLGLHGHVHEGRGFVRIGRTWCFNPGSCYDRGLLQGILVLIDGKTVVSYLPVVG